MEDLVPISHFSPNIGGFIYGDWSSSHRHMAKFYQSCKNWGSSKPIGSMVLLYMVTWIPSICPQMLAYIPAPWILWEILSVFFSASALWDGVRTGTPTGPADHGGPTEISWGAPVGRIVGNLAHGNLVCWNEDCFSKRRLGVKIVKSWSCNDHQLVLISIRMNHVRSLDFNLFFVFKLIDSSLSHRNSTSK